MQKIYPQYHIITVMDDFRTVDGPIEYSLDIAGPYGDMPSSMLTSKFEETDVDESEMIFDDYARNTLTDWSPDTATFAHEEARGSVTARSGRLNWQYYGHRGTADDPYRPEIFDGFGGAEDRDPRGINVDPDFKELRRQGEARMRFVRFSPDMCDQITGGGISEAQVMANHQKIFRHKRENLKIFSQQIDGRREGLRRTYRNADRVSKQIRVQSYGDLITDQGLNTQRRAGIICKAILRDTRGFRMECLDQDMAFARYTQLCRRRQTKNTHNTLETTRQSADLAESTVTQQKKAVGLLMANIVRGKRAAHEMMAGSDRDFAASKQDVARKTAPFTRDLTAILQDGILADARFARGDETMVGKTPGLVMREHMARHVANDHVDPIAHNAEMIYKTLMPGADMRKAKDAIITDARDPQVRETLTGTQGRKASRRTIAGAKLNRTYDQRNGTSDVTVNYRTMARGPADGARLRNTSGENYAGKSDNSQIRRKLHQNYRASDVNDTEEDMKFQDNTKKERHGGGIGSKYTTRFIERDGRGGDMSSLT